MRWLLLLLLLWAPGLAEAVTLSENWNCADSASLTCQLTWDESGGANAWGITTNRAQFSGDLADQTFGRAETDLAGGDHYVEATLAVLTHQANRLEIGVMCRRNSSGAASGYIWQAQPNNGNYGLFRMDAGAMTSLGTFTTTPAVNDVLRIVCDGTTIIGRLNGVDRVTATSQTSYQTNVRTGIYGFSNNTNNVGALDTWTAEDIAAAATVLPCVIGGGVTRAGCLP